jgi:Ca2+-binding RTX toxin-like protein
VLGRRSTTAFTGTVIAVAIVLTQGAAAIRHHYDAPTAVDAEPANVRDDAFFGINADDGPSDIAVSSAQGPATYVVSDDNRVDGSGTCVSGGKHRVVCDAPAEPAALDLSARLGAGDDELRIRSSVRYRSANLRGGVGDNRLSGGLSHDVIHGAPFGGSNVLLGHAGDDALRGGARDDLLRGGAGADRLVPRDGTDVIAGGGGDDTVISSDGNREPELSCGGGRDHLIADRRDPRPDDCEEIEIVSPGGGVPG